MGLFNGGLFDFNGDGKSSLGEEFMGVMILNEVFGEAPDDDEEEDKNEEE